MKKVLSDFKPKEQGLNKVLGNLESEIMEIIWRKGSEVCVRDVLEELASRRKIAYTTVMTIMIRLSEKKILEKRKEGNTFFFIPAMSKELFTRNVVGNVVDSLLEDFADATMSHFLSRVKKGDRKTIEKLENLIASYEAGEVDDSQ